MVIFIFCVVCLQHLYVRFSNIPKLGHGVKVRACYPITANIPTYQHILSEGVEGYEGGEPAHELGDHAELDQILRLNIGK